MVNDTISSSPRGIQSIEVGGQLLTALAHHGRPLALKDLAAAAGMAAAKAHPYLVSFIKIGLVEQDGSKYGLGPLALQLGLISLQQYEPVRLATPRIEALALEIGHTVAIAVWGSRGPTIVRVAEAPSPVHISMRHGTVMSLRGTASGRLFTAYLPAGTAAAADTDTDTGKPLGTQASAAIRKAGLAHSQDGVVMGVSALAAPVFDDQGHIVLSLTAIVTSGSFNLAADGPIALALRRAGVGLSQQLGWRAASTIDAV